jgi:putative phage-type endonuclease
MAKPILLCDTAGMDRTRWLECRMHGPDGKIPFTIGGSDVSAVFGVNPWTTPLELWQIKKGLRKPDDSLNQWAKEMGHIMEPVVATCYAAKTGNTILEDTGLYQHAHYPFALANIDYGLVDAGADGILECKTTTYHKASSWSDGMVPYYYELQVRFYLAVMDREYADICCMWGYNPETDMVIQRINRDRVIEKEIFDRLSDFWNSLIKGVPPAMTEVEPVQAMNALAVLLGKSDSRLPTIELPKKFLKKASHIASLQEERRQIDKRKRDIEKQIAAHSVAIAETMQQHAHGIVEDTGKRYLIDYITKERTSPDHKKLKADFPKVYEDVLKQTSSRSIQVREETA